MIQTTDAARALAAIRSTAIEFGLPNGGVRMRVRAPESPRRPFLAALSGMAFLAALLLAAYVPASPTWIDAALLAAGGAGLFACLRRRREALLFFDRAGIYDSLARRPPIAWWRIERVETVAATDGQPARLAVCLSEGGRTKRIDLPATAATGLPVPFEYLVVQLHRRGAPIRRPEPAFDPFEHDVRWLPAEQAAELLGERMGERARPHAGQLLDIAETRGDRPAFEHWMAVVAALRQRAGLVEAAED